MSDSDALLSIGHQARLELDCEIAPGGGRVAAFLDGARLFDREVGGDGAEVGALRFVLPPISPGQHVLRLTLFRASLEAVARVELLTDGESAYQRISRAREEGLLSDVVVYLDIGRAEAESPS